MCSLLDMGRVSQSSRNYEVVQLSLYQLRPGMILGKDIRNNQSVLILARGYLLSRVVIFLLRQHPASSLPGLIDVEIPHDPAASVAG